MQSTQFSQCCAIAALTAVTVCCFSTDEINETQVLADIFIDKCLKMPANA
jgi:hypothetical protein